MSNNYDDHDLAADDPTLSEQARALIRIGESGIAKENRPAMEAYFAPDFIFHGPGAAELDREGLWSFFAATRASLSDLSITRQAVFSDGDHYVGARTTFAGRFTATMHGTPVGSIEPHGGEVSFQVNNVFRFDDAGLLAEEWARYDQYQWLLDLGVDLTPRAAAA